MKIAHIGPPLARRGGPAGYLWQLATAVDSASADPRHTLTFPPREVPPPPRRPSVASRARRVAGDVKRALLGPPTFHRPSTDDLRREGGAIDTLLRASAQSACAESAVGIDAAPDGGADVLFAHEAAVAEQLLAVRRPGQQVWLMMHSPIPFGLYLAWSFGIPEWDWTEIARLPDVSRWTQWEVDLCGRVDRLIMPCPEAAAELVRADARFAALSSIDYVLTGGAGPPRRFRDESVAALRRRWRLPERAPTGLFLGSAQPYRGLDVLCAAAAALPASMPGTIVVAGPAPASVPSHPRIRALGTVRDVSDLLHAADFVVNVNRFNLFDLSTIEAAEAGRPMLLHATGGNLRFQQLGLGCRMLADVAPATIAEGLSDLFTMNEGAQRDLGAASRRCYEQHLTPAHLWRRHVEMYDHAASAHSGVLQATR
jgi:glycosyltransferase involved in cell wall biosynthesis